MFASITLENFFSFAGPVRIPLNAGANVLIGINGSGKSNCIRAIQLLHEAVAGEGFEKVFQKEWGGFTNVAFFGQQQADAIRLQFEFDHERLNERKGFRFPANPVYEIVIHRQGERGYYLEEQILTDTGNVHPFIYLHIQRGQGVISARSSSSQAVSLVRYPDEEHGVALSPSELALRQVADPLSFFPLHTLRQAIESIAAYGYFDTSAHSAIRQAAGYDTSDRLRPDGANLVSLLIRLKNNRSLYFEELEKVFSSINPHFKGLSFDPIGARMLLTLMERNLGRTVSVEHISDGSLRFLILLSILLNPDRGSLIVLDEPETGLHPDMIRTVSQLIQAAGTGSQLLAATHSPALLNGFEVDDVLIFEKNSSNQTTVAYKAEAEFPAWQEGFTTGQLWLQGKIGGTRW